MRILVLSNHYPPHSIGHYELQCYQVCQELGRRSHQVAVATSLPPPEKHSLPVPGRVTRKLELYPEEAPSFHRLFNMVRANRAVLENQIAALRPEVIMVWGMEGLPVSLLEQVESSGIPVVYAVYDYWLANAADNDAWLRFWDEGETTAAFSRTLLKGLRLDGLVCRQAPKGEIGSLRLDHVSFCSDSLRRTTEAACDRSMDHALVIPCGVSPGSIRPREGLAAVNYRLLFAARLSDEKDPMTALRALQELRHRGDERFTLDIYGRGKPEFEAALHDYVRRFQLGGSVSFKPVAEEQTGNNLHLYDAFICTSKHPEPFPLMHLKAMAARVPVISTMEGGCAELIRDGENGLAFQTSNHYHLADAITRLADNRELALQLMENAYSEVRQHYGIQRITSRIEYLLHRATGTADVLETAA